MKNKEQQIKELESLYWKHNQMLYVSPIEMWDDECTWYEVYAWEPVEDKEYNYEHEIYLFDVLNLEHYNKSTEYLYYDYFNNPISRGMKLARNREEVAMASNMPLYMEERVDDYGREWIWKRFLLKKFTPITRDDILNCTNHYLHRVLDSVFIHNIEITE